MPNASIALKFCSSPKAYEPPDGNIVTVDAFKGPVNSVNFNGFDYSINRGVMSEIDAFVSSTGSFNINTLDHGKKIKDNAFVEINGHFDNEFNLAGLESLDHMESTISSLRRLLRLLRLCWLQVDCRHCLYVLRDVVFTLLTRYRAQPSLLRNCCFYERQGKKPLQEWTLLLLSRFLQ